MEMNYFNPRRTTITSIEIEPNLRNKGNIPLIFFNPRCFLINTDSLNKAKQSGLWWKFMDDESIEIFNAILKDTDANILFTGMFRMNPYGHLLSNLYKRNKIQFNEGRSIVGELFNITKNEDKIPKIIKVVKKYHISKYIIMEPDYFTKSDIVKQDIEQVEIKDHLVIVPYNKKISDDFKDSVINMLKG